MEHRALGSNASLKLCDMVPYEVPSSQDYLMTLLLALTDLLHFARSVH